MRVSKQRRMAANLVGLSRLELPTSPLSGVRSNHLSYRPVLACLLYLSLRCQLRSISHVLQYTPFFAQLPPCTKQNNLRYIFLYKRNKLYLLYLMQSIICVST